MNDEKDDFKNNEKPTDEKELELKKHKKRKSRIKELEEALSEGLKENAQLKDNLLRRMADFENYKKRVEKEFSEITLKANAEFAKDILQVLDELEISLKKSKENSDFETFYEGINLIYNKFIEILKSKGIQLIESIGKEFDVEKHDAILMMEKEGTPSNIIIDEYQKGYLINDKVLRHAKVVVNK